MDHYSCKIYVKFTTHNDVIPPSILEYLTSTDCNVRKTSTATNYGSQTLRYIGLNVCI